MISTKDFNEFNHPLDKQLKQDYADQAEEDSEESRISRELSGSVKTDQESLISSSLQSSQNQTSISTFLQDKESSSLTSYIQ